MASLSHYIFVYGTLKSGQPNHYLIDNLLNKNVLSFIGKGILKEKHPLIIATQFNIPHILDTSEFGHNVIGEIYYFPNDKSLVTLDELEDHPLHYERKICPVLKINDEQNDEIKCWVYLLTDFKPEFLNYPYIEEYYDGIFGNFYVMPHQRPKNGFTLDLVKKD